MKSPFPKFGIDPYFIMGLFAVLVAGGVYRLRAAPTLPRPDVTHINSTVTNQLDRLGVRHDLGRPGAPVHIVELFDYECPACAVAHRTTWSAIDQRIKRGEIRYTAYDLPLPNHASAIPAAIISHCVADQSAEQFWALRHHLFEKQKTWAEAYPVESALLRIALAVGSDTAGIRACVGKTGPARAASLRRSSEIARVAGITYTPAWAVNGKVVPWMELEAEIEKATRPAR